MTSVDTSALDTLAATPAVLRALLGAPPHGVVTEPVDGGWSPRDVVAHLAAQEPWAFRGRIETMLSAAHPPVPNVDEQETLDRSGLRGRPTDESIDTPDHLRAEDVPWLRTLDADAFARTGEHAIAGSISVADVIHHLAYHDLLHIQQATRMLTARHEPLRGRMRMF